MWKQHPARTELRALYEEVDALMAPFSCPASADCCHFARTGREPYPHAVEIAEVEHAIRASNVSLSKASRLRSDKKAKSLRVIADERRCPLLGADDRCRIYASRPFGCRTYFCHRALGPEKLPRERLRDVGQRIANLSTRAFPRDPGPRALTKALERPRANR
jgi:Fe-S-cluster containining protein